ncbi:arsenate reductase family protein [Blautia faecicola]|uniref:Uncharacterized protein n=1 Tax=Blautia faecicola TaxID=2509240 RepID=A0A4Q1RLB5_9FIRM|nr:hypothetical protein [Blautia faecicola]RXS76533.1 hypothetical protein ETP43_15845 [Blautia faecicola]
MSSSGRRATNRPSRKARLSKGEFNSVAQANGGLENPQVIKTPVVRNGKQSTHGYQPDVWKAWKIDKTF